MAWSRNEWRIMGNGWRTGPCFSPKSVCRVCCVAHGYAFHLCCTRTRRRPRKKELTGGLVVISRASLVVASARMQNRRRRFSSHCCASCFLSASVGWPARLAHQPHLRRFWCQRREMTANHRRRAASSWARNQSRRRRTTTACNIGLQHRPATTAVQDSPPPWAGFARVAVHLLPTPGRFVQIIGA